MSSDSLTLFGQWSTDWLQGLNGSEDEDSQTSLDTSTYKQPARSTNHGTSSARSDGTSSPEIGESQVVRTSAASSSDDKVYQLVRAIEQRREIWFVPGLDDTTFDIFVDQSAQSSPESTNEALELARSRLEGYVMTDTPSHSTFATIGSAEDSSSEFERDLFIGFEGVHQMDPSGESVVGQDSVRVSHFADALARMEGRIPPNPSSPIRRYVHPDEYYKENVELEHWGPVLKCPRPISWANRIMMGRLFQFGTDGESDHLEVHGSAMHDDLNGRPMNPTPDRAIFHNDEVDFD